MRLSEIYEPREDSFFMKEMVLRFAKDNVLDMGCGSGIQALTALSKKNVKKVIAVDINKKAIDSSRKLSKKITWINCNLFEKLGKKYFNFFDTIIFNPPYLPKEGKNKVHSLDGGKRGFELSLKFLKDAKQYLKPKGIILLLFSSISQPDIILNFADTQLYTQKLIGVKSLFFEELYIYMFKKSDVLNKLEKKGIKNICFFDNGSRGIISTAEYKRKKVAIKTKKPSSEAKNTIAKETKWLKFVNKFKIGPEFILSGKDFLVYKFVEGIPFHKWIEKASKTRLKKVLLEILEKCHTLDGLKVNKEEMHRPLTNLRITKNTKPVLIDFERMYKTNKPHNVTQFCQFLIGRVNLFRKKGFMFTKNKLITAASRYKNKKGDEYFIKLKELIK